MGVLQDEVLSVAVRAPKKEWGPHRGGAWKRAAIPDVNGKGMIVRDGTV